MATKTKKSVLAEIIISLVFGLIFGGLVLFLSTLGADTIIKWVLIVTGIIIVITNIAPLIRGIVNLAHKEKGGLFDVIVSAIAMVLGIVMIVYQNAIVSTIITVLLAIYLIVLPIIRIVIAPSKKEQLSKEWIRILIGAILIVFLPAILGAADAIINLLLMIVGIVIIVLTVLSFVLSLIAYIKATKKADEEAPVEVEAETAEATEE
ncbi:MAG: OadG family protein [Clostridia bacterium]|nr:OadG family protein [Clostridia bacterium]